MNVTIEALGRQHLQDAAGLFAVRHAGDRGRWPYLPPEYELESEVCLALAALLEQDGTHGVVALGSGRVVGYLLGRAVLPAPASPAASIWKPRSAGVAYHGHAVQPEGAYDIYREMYCALSAQWVAAGLFAHYVNVNSCDAATLEAFSSLGFGRDLVRAVRSTAPPVEVDTAPNIEIRRAGAEDLDDVVRLQLELFRYHAGAPIYAPFLPEAFSGQRALAEELLSSPECAVMLAVRGGRAVGLQTLKPSEAHPGTPADTVYLTEGFTDEEVRGTGVGAALLAGSMEWARERGYEWCLLNFLPANILAARFWTRSGFEPLGYRMMRVVDERIALARG